MSQVICRRAGCQNTLIDVDAEKGYEHCSSECCEACDDLDPTEYADKQAGHMKRLAEDRDIARLGRAEHEEREHTRQRIRKLRGSHKRKKKNPETLRARRSAGKRRREQ